MSKFPTSSLWASFAGRFIAIGAVSALSALSSVACSADAQDSQVGDEESDWTKTKNATPNEVLLMVSVDWEGRDLTEANISAMESLRTRYPDVRITHFLNAAYFTKPGAVASDVAARMERPLRPNDEQGLHIHGWKRLFEAAGVTFRATPTFWGEGRGLSDDCSQDCGHEVPISAYTEDELRKVVHFSLDTLETNGFTRAKSFRCGGWMAKPNVLAAIRAEGIKNDASAVNTPFLKSEIGTLPLYDWLADLWPNMTDSTQPYSISTEHGALTEIPDNGALADYMRADEMVSVYTDNRDKKLGSQKSPIVMNIGFHQETAARFVPAVITALDGVYAQAKKDGIKIRPVTMSQRL